MKAAFITRRTTLAIVLCLALFVLFMESSEKRHSLLKSWLYENGITHELVVATVALMPDKNPAVTRKKIANMVTGITTSDRGVELIVFGETILGWYRTETRDYYEAIAEAIPGTTTNLVSRLARKHRVHITFGMVERSGGQIFNTQVFIDHTGEIRQIQRKKNPKSRFFDPGQTPISFVDINGIKAGIVICYDIQWPETVNAAREHGADLIILSNADYIDEWDDVLFAYRYLAKRYGAWLVTANRYGDEFQTHWDGHIEILSPFGDVERAAKSAEQYVVHNLRMNAEPSSAQKLAERAYSKLSTAYLVIKHPRIAFSYL